MRLRHTHRNGPRPSRPVQLDGRDLASHTYTQYVVVEVARPLPTTTYKIGRRLPDTRAGVKSAYFAEKTHQNGGF